MITQQTHKECPDCYFGFQFEYVGAPAEKCPSCEGGFVPLTQDEIIQQKGWNDQLGLHRRNLRLSNRI